MAEAKYYIEIKKEKVPVIVRNYRNSYRIKMFFRGNILNISKPASVSFNKIMKLIQENEEKLYSQYQQIISEESKEIKHWNTGEKILYKGQEHTIIREQTNKQSISIAIEQDTKQFKITVPKELAQKADLKSSIDRGMKELLKNNTGVIIQERLPYWSKVTNIPYHSFKIRDAISRFGSCVPELKKLNFNARLVMLPEDKIDAIIVHELCHIIHPNHSKDFYNLVKTYIPNYDKIDKWLKQNSSLIKI